MPPEIPERVAVVEDRQEHYSEAVRELRREMILLRQQLDAFVRDASPIIEAVRAQQSAKAKFWNAVSIKVAEYSIVAILVWVARGAYMQAADEVAKHIQK